MPDGPFLRPHPGTTHLSSLAFSYVTVKDEISFCLILYCCKYVFVQRF